MRLCWLLLFLVVTSEVSGDPDLRQLLHIWRPTPTLNWGNVTPECAQAMDSFSLALSQRQQWASSMLDATGQATPQFLQSANFWLGSWSQCEHVNEDFYMNNTTEISIAAYRVLKLKVDVTEPLTAPKFAPAVARNSVPRHIWMGVCVPGACGDAAQVSALLRQMLDAAQPESNFRHVQLVKVKILPNDFSIWGGTSTSLLVVFTSTILILTLLGTGFTECKQIITENGNSDSWRAVLLAFSFTRNFRKMFNASSNTEGIPALHGLRVFGMAWIVLLHFILYTVVLGEDPSFRRNAEKHISFPILANGHIVVDTFFFISGVLFSYIFLRYEVGRTRNSLGQASLKFLGMVFYRLARLTLPHAFTILMVTTFFQYLNEHSEFENTTASVESCTKFWWRNLVYVNNLYDHSEFCLRWTWYLSADTQLYVLSAPILLLFVNGFQRTAVVLSSLLLLASWLATAAISFSIGNVPSVQNPFRSFELIYSKPWSHLGAVWVGMYAGWMIQRGSFKVGKIGLVFGWIASIFGLLFTLFVVHWGNAFNVASGAVYEALKSTVWAGSFAWILLACVFKKAGWIGDLIESPFFAPFGRATYCTYLLHVPLLEWIFLTLHGPLPVSFGLSVIVATGLIVTSNILGVVASLLLESPVFSLLDLIRHVNVGDRECQQDNSIGLRTKSTNNEVK